MALTAHVDNRVTPGQLVRDAGTFHQILDGSNLTTSGDSGWLDIGFVHKCIAHVELGAMAGTLDIVLEQADDSSGTNANKLHTFDQFGATDDNEEAKAFVNVNQRYVKATYTAAASGGVCTLTLRLPYDHYDTAMSSTSS